MHCGVKVMSKVKERRLAETAEGCRRLRRLPKAVERLAGLSGAAEGCRKLARVKGLSKAAGVVEERGGAVGERVVLITRRSVDTCVYTCLYTCL